MKNGIFAMLVVLAACGGTDPTLEINNNQQNVQRPQDQGVNDEANLLMRICDRCLSDADVSAIECLGDAGLVIEECL